MLWLSEKIIFHDPTTHYVYKGDEAKKKLIPAHKSLFSGTKGVGLPIGNLTSQFFANVYLDAFDHFVTDTLGMKKYIRYVDDFIFVDEDMEKLHSRIPLMQTFLEEQRGLKIHPKKIRLQEVAKGVDFLGYVVRPNYILVRQKVVRRLKKRMYDFEQEYSLQGEKMTEESKKDFLNVVNSYKGHFSHAQSFRLREAVTQKVKRLFGEHPQ